MCIRKNSNFVALIKFLAQLDMRYQRFSCKVRNYQYTEFRHQGANFDRNLIDLLNKRFSLYNIRNEFVRIIMPVLSLDFVNAFPEQERSRCKCDILERIGTTLVYSVI